MKKIITSTILGMLVLAAMPASTFALSPAIDSNGIITYPPVTMCVQPMRNLGVGSRGVDVTGLQVMLREGKFLAVEPTGYFGPLTKAAVIKYQGQYGIPQTGFVGPLTRAKLALKLLCNNDVVKNVVSVSVKTDKAHYSPTDTITITLTAKNTASTTKTLNFNSCQTNYMIGEFNDIIRKLCAQALTSVTLAPGESKVWTMSHDLSIDPLPAGTHIVKAELLNNNGSAATSIKISNVTPPTVSGMNVTSPTGDATWALSSSQKITWTDSKTYIQAPKYDVKVQLEHCEPNQPCTLIYHIPVTIAKDIADTQFTWNVGARYIDPAQAPFVKVASVSEGKYRIYVCAAGTPADDVTNCVKSAGRVTLKNEAVATKPVTITVGGVGKKIYASNEKFDLVIAAQNTSSSTQKLGFTSSCQVSYKIDNAFNYMAARSCLMALTEVSIAPGESKTWTITHDPAEYAIPSGVHTITAEVIGHGSATTSITVQ